MRTILPRLRNLLAMLASEPDPVPVREMADRLRVSRRTVFRELANVDSVLRPYGLEVGSRSGEGITLEGCSRAKSALLDDLGRLERTGPADKRERQDRLVQAILRSPGRKLAVYAETLQVSAPTISHDLDELEPWLEERGLRLQRRTGSGIAIAGGEMRIRRVLLTLLARMRGDAGAPGSYPHPDILLDLLDMKDELDSPLAWTTPQSRDALNRFMAVMVQRIMDGCPSGPAGDGATEYALLAERLSVVLHEAFNIAIDGDEKAWLAIELSACRTNVSREKRPADAALEALAGEMIALFDPERAAVLKMDEVLVDGLVSHLRSAIVRIRHRIELVDPMRAQITEAYPDIIGRCRAACEVLKPYGDWIPEDEISLVAAHFGAALLRLSEHGLRQRAARVGIICVHGIGSSYLLASQVKRAFASRVTAEVGCLDDRENWQRYDLLVSTTALPGADIPVVIVPPMLGDDDIRRIGELLSGQRPAAEAADGGGNVFLDNVRVLRHLAGCVGGLLERFVVERVPSTLAFEELAGAAGRLFGQTPAEAAAIAAGLVEREAISTQVVAELGLVLLHCRTDAVSGPVFGCVNPEDGRFAAPYFKNASAGVIMLLPRSAQREVGEMMGCLSAALVEQTGFRDAVLRGAQDEIVIRLERILGEFLFQFSMQKLKG